VRDSEGTCFVAPRWRQNAKVNGSTELAEVLGPTGSFCHSLLGQPDREQRPFGFVSARTRRSASLAKIWPCGGSGVRALKRENPGAPAMNVFVKGFALGQLSLL